MPKDQTRIDAGLLSSTLASSISPSKNGWAVMLEIPEDNYFELNLETVRTLVKMGYCCVYVSMHRPYPNLQAGLSKTGVPKEKIWVVDAASSIVGAPSAQKNCTFLANPLSVDDLTRAIFQAAPRLSGDKKCVFLDSVTTLAVYQPLSETLRFAEFISRSLRKEEVNGILVNVANGLAQKKFIRDIALSFDQVIRVERMEK